jgi:hypothetical protein
MNWMNFDGGSGCVRIMATLDEVRVAGFFAWNRNE